MNAHRFRCRKQPRSETVLHERLTSTQGESTKHQLEPVAIFLQRFYCSLKRDRYPIHHVPGVGIVPVQTTELTAGGPGHDPTTRPIDSRAGGERMQEAHVPRLERRRYCRLGNSTCVIYAQLERIHSLERDLLFRFPHLITCHE